MRDASGNQPNAPANRFTGHGRQVAFEIHASRWRGGSLIAEEERHRLTSNLYFCAELVMMIERAGFTDVEVRGEYNDLAPTAEDAFLIYVATRE